MLRRKQPSEVSTPSCLFTCEKLGRLMVARLCLHRQKHVEIFTGCPCEVGKDIADRVPAETHKWEKKEEVSNE
jgi:hypothetical protein